MEGGRPVKIVIDVGCARYGGDYSVERLIEEFQPDTLYGFDPHPSVPGQVVYLNMGKLDLESGGLVPPDGPNIILERKAAWVYDGTIGYLEDGLNSTLTDREDAPQVECFDLAEFIFDLTRRSSEAPKIILKMDAEGAEYELLEHLISTGADELLELAWIEWHPKKMTLGERRRRGIERNIHCELAEWLW